MAREQSKLLPVAVLPLTPVDLREFVDASYEDLTDYVGQEKHFGWSQTLKGIAQRLDTWAEVHPDDTQTEIVLGTAAKVRHLAIQSRPAFSGDAEKSSSERAVLWEKLKQSRDTDRIRRFADAFPGSMEGFNARELAAAIEAHDEIVAKHRKGEFGIKPEDFETVSARIERACAEAQDTILENERGPIRQGATNYELNEHLSKLGKYRTILSSDAERWRQYLSSLTAFLERWPTFPNENGIMEETSRVGGMLFHIDRVTRELDAIMSPLFEARDAAYNLEIQSAELAKAKDVELAKSIRREREERDAEEKRKEEERPIVAEAGKINRKRETREVEQATREASERELASLLTAAKYLVGDVWELVWKLGLIALAFYGMAKCAGTI